MNVYNGFTLFPTKVTRLNWLKIYNTHTEQTEFTLQAQVLHLDWALFKYSL